MIIRHTNKQVHEQSTPVKTLTYLKEKATKALYLSLTTLATVMLYTYLTGNPEHTDNTDLPGQPLGIITWELAWTGLLTASITAIKIKNPKYRFAVIMAWLITGVTRGTALWIAYGMSAVALTAIWAALCIYLVTTYLLIERV